MLALSPSKSLGECSPRKAHAASVQSVTNETKDTKSCRELEEIHFEDSFRGYLGSLKHTIMSCTHANFDNERSVLRAQELVKEDIRKSMFQLSATSKQQPTYAQKVTAFSYVGAKLLGEVEEMQNLLTLTNQVETLTSENEKLKSFYQRREIESNTAMAALQKRHSELSVSNKQLEERVRTLSAEAADTQRELDIRSTMDNDTHERYVQLQMEIATYHSTVKRKAEDSLGSVKAKVGFVPREVETQLRALQQLQPPGVDLLLSAPPSSASSPARKKRAVHRPHKKQGIRKKNSNDTRSAVLPSDEPSVLVPNEIYIGGI